MTTLPLAIQDAILRLRNSFASSLARSFVHGVVRKSISVADKNRRRNEGRKGAK